MVSMWYENKDNLMVLARYLHEIGQWDGKEGVSNLLYYFQKPWKYDEEWQEFQKSKKAS